MNKKEIFIVSAPIRSGKTTSLLKFISDRSDAFGILTPVINGQRIFMDVHTKDIFPMEAQAGDENVLIGKYSFIVKSFHRAIQILRSALEEKSGWLIVDEIGPLELRGDGFHNVIKEMLSSDSKMKFIFIIRDSALNRVLEFFNLNEYAQVAVNPSFLKPE